MRIPDYHTHTPLCKHAQGEPTEYAARAADLGLLEIGFSDHSPMRRDGFDDWRMDLAEFPVYLEKVAAARRDHPQIPVRLGLEVDYFEDGEDWCRELAALADFDYLIGSVHYIGGDPQSRWDIDNPKWLGRWRDAGAAELDEMWSEYWRVYARCAGSGLFDILAHPDLPKKFGYRPAGDLERYYAPAVEAAAASGACFEINTAGLRKEVREMYPAPAFLRMARAAGVPLVISSDAHAPGEVAAGFAEAVELAARCGYTELATFARRRRGSIPLPPADG